MPRLRPIAAILSGGSRVITKPFILAKDNYLINAKTLPDNKIIRDHGAFPAAFAKRTRPVLPKRRMVRIYGQVPAAFSGSVPVIP
jgi:hypothetical protein